MRDLCELLFRTVVNIGGDSVTMVCKQTAKASEELKTQAFRMFPQKLHGPSLNPVDWICVGFCQIQICKTLSPEGQLKPHGAARTKQQKKKGTGGKTQHDKTSKTATNKIILCSQSQISIKMEEHASLQ